MLKLYSLLFSLLALLGALFLFAVICWATFNADTLAAYLKNRSGDMIKAEQSPPLMEEWPLITAAAFLIGLACFILRRGQVKLERKIDRLWLLKSDNPAGRRYG